MVQKITYCQSTSMVCVSSKHDSATQSRIPWNLVWRCLAKFDKAATWHVAVVAVFLSGVSESCSSTTPYTPWRARGITCRQPQRRLRLGFPLVFSAPTAQFRTILVCCCCSSWPGLPEPPSLRSKTKQRSQCFRALPACENSPPFTGDPLYLFLKLKF